MKEKRLITTLLSSNNDYYWGVLGLYYSLQKYNPEIPFCVIVLEDIDKKILNILEKHGISYRVFPRENFDTPDINNLNTTFNKFYSLCFIEYDKVLFMDADILVTQNIDYYFDYDIPNYILTSKLPSNYISNAVGLYKPNLFYFNFLKKYKNKGVDDENLLTNLYWNAWEERNYWLPMLYIDIDKFKQYQYPPIIHQFGPNKYWRKWKFNDKTIKIFAQNFPELLFMPDLEPNLSNWLEIYKKENLTF